MFKRCEGGRGGGGIGEAFFHPDHVVPAAELEAAAGELAHGMEAHAGMEAYAGEGEVFVFFLRAGNAGVEQQQVLRFEAGFQGVVEPGACAAAAGVLRHVDGGFGAPFVGLARMEGRGVGVAENGSFVFRHDPRIAGEGMAHPPFELPERGDFVFEADGRFPDVGGVDVEKRGSVGRGRRADADVFHDGLRGDGERLASRAFFIS